MKKVAILHNTGNVGKSFLGRELFYSRIKEKGIYINVESHNSGTKKFEKVKTETIEGNEFDKLFPLMYQYDEFVIDVGVSQIIPFLTELTKAKDIFDGLDAIIVPTTYHDKINDDTIKTLELLDELGFKNKVRVILNQADNLKKFDHFFTRANEIGYVIDKNLRVLEYSVIDKMSQNGMTAFELANDIIDYKKLAQDSFKKNDLKAGKEQAELDYMKKFSIGIQKNMDDVYAILSPVKKIEDDIVE